MNWGSLAGMGTRERVASEINSFLVEHLFRGHPWDQGKCPLNRDVPALNGN